MSARIPRTSTLPAPVDRDRDAVLLDAAAKLGSRTAQASHEHVLKLAGEVYDAIVGRGVPIRTYLGNLVAHSLRGRLRAETIRDDARAAAALATPRDPRPVVVGFDGSPAAESALDRALSIGEGLGAPVRLVAAWQYPLTYGRFPLAKWHPAADIQLVIDASVARRFGDGIPPWFTTATVEGPPARTLIAESRAAQMLVVGSRGHGGFAGLLLGSVSSACAEHAGGPVLVMHAPRTEREDPVSAGAEALGDGSRASDVPAVETGAAVLL